MRATIDFESRSACLLRKTGSWRYSMDPTTEPLCLAFRLPYWPEGQTGLWHPAFPQFDLPERADDHLAELFTWILLGDHVEAHNAWFERGIWTNIMAPRYGWPEVPHTSWRCSAAKAAAHALPRALDQAVHALGLSVLKDTEGAKVMKKLAKPRKPRKAERVAWAAQHGDTPHPLVYHESREMLETLWAYCRQDVLAEEALSRALDDLSPDETAIYLLDQRINERGFQLDTRAVTRALTLITSETDRLNTELCTLTGGNPSKATQRAKMQAWFASYGLDLPNTQKATITDALEDGDDEADAGEEDALEDVDDVCASPGPSSAPEVRRALTILQTLSLSSTAKYQAMERWACPDGRARGGLLYHGASTGRWCLTGDHEVLTLNGWERLDTWTGGRIACWNDTECVVFAESQRVSFPYDGPLLHLCTNRLDQLATPDHRMPTYDRKTGQFTVKRLQDFKAREQVPFTGTRQSYVPLEETLWRVLVMVQADGHYAEDGQIRLRFRKQRKIDRCRQLLRRAGVTYSEASSSAENTTTFTLRKRHLPLWLQMFRDKTFGPWLLDAPASVFFEELPYWDGYRCGPQSVQYATTNKTNADWVQALAHTSGRAASITVRTGDRWNACYYVSIWLAPSNRHELRHRATTHLFTGEVYCATTPTGFFLVRRHGKVWVTGNSGSGIQPQNFPKGCFKEADSPMTDIWGDILSAVDLETKYGTSTLQVLSHALRGAITASPGKHLFVADYASIEVRVLLWLADDHTHLEMLRSGVDMYVDMASKIYDRPLTKADKTERQLGKVAILGLGYQLGASKFVDAARLMGGVTIDEEFAQTVVTTYREDYHRVVSLWYDTQDAAIAAVESPGSRERARHVTYVVDDPRFLFAYLPSGRRLVYPFPEVHDRRTPWGAVKPALTFMGVDPRTHKWTRQFTYGGCLVENNTQATARDVMAEALLRAEATGVYLPVLSVHDELICEAHPLLGDVQEFERLLAQVPTWATGCPIAADAWSGPRYHK